MCLRMEENKYDITLRDWQARAYKFFREYPNCILNACTGCLTGDTLIETQNGVMKIVDIYTKKLTPIVLSADIINKIYQYKQSQGAVYSGEKETFLISYGNDKYVQATKDHKFLMKEGEFLKYYSLYELVPGDILIGSNGEEYKIESITPNGLQDTYDIMEVEDNHNFIANGVIVSNSGKTVQAIYTIKKLIEEDPYLRILIVGPKNVILEQAWMEDMYKFGIGMDKIGLYNGFTREFSQITLISIQSMKNLLDSGIYDMFDCVIFDEVHNYGTKNYLKLISIPKKYKIGLTASLERQDRKHIEIKQHFGNNIFKYEIEEGINDGVINPFKFFHMSIVMDEDTKEKYEQLTDRLNYLLKSMGGIDLSKLKPGDMEHAKIMKVLSDRKQLISNYSQKAVVAKSIIMMNPTSKIIVFNQYNKTSRDLYWELQDSEVRCDIMNSDLNTKQQFEIFKKFEGDEMEVILATTLLDEGYNLPKIDVAILMAQNSTDKQFIQRMGRVLRKKEKISKVYYITVQDTFEEKYFLDKQERIKKLALTYEEVVV